VPSVVGGDGGRETEVSRRIRKCVRRVRFYEPCRA
jgi:hypothetical protein